MEDEVAPAQARYAAATRRAVPARRVARSARQDVQQLETESEEQQQDATTEIARVEADHEQEVDDRDEQVAFGIGLAIAAAVLAAIAFGWGRFRTSSSVTWLSEQETAQAAGLCMFGGLVLIVVGAVIGSGGGVAGAIGTATFVLGIGLPVAFLLARHSVRIQAGKGAPLTGERGLPSWVLRAVGVGMALIFVVGLAGAIFADDPEALEVPEQLRQAAAGENAGAERRLTALQAEAEKLQAIASPLTAKQNAARVKLAAARRSLGRAEGRLASAKGDVQRYSRRLAALEKREARELEEVEEEAVEIEEEGGGSGECDPNYVGACLDPSSPDYDCAGGSGDGPDYTGPVQVVGSDPFGLDADGDGYACE